MLPDAPTDASHTPTPHRASAFSRSRAPHEQPRGALPAVDGARRKGWPGGLPWLVLVTCMVGGLTLLLDLTGSDVPARILATSYSLTVAVVQAYAMLKDVRQGHWGVDLLALMAIIATAATGEHYASLVVVLMIAGGQALDEFASTRAQTELRVLLERAPHTAHRIAAAPPGSKSDDGAGDDTVIEDVPIGEL
ncbi:hypothetical protein [Arthrobacter sp. NPDC092385]|uniref:hypothetical protein n=1 Tax=Arthrobacter sp. NPDC092385 TaxID=3363943 RepID=UPI0038208ACB